MCVWGGEGGKCVGEVSVWGEKGGTLYVGCACVYRIHSSPPSISSPSYFSSSYVFLYTSSLSSLSSPSPLPLLSLSSPSSPSFPLTTPKVNFNEPLSTSCYAANRVNKLFNPMLGETYECDQRAELGWRCFMEQVRGGVTCEGGVCGRGWRKRGW